MKSDGVINLILPASGIIAEYQPTENILQSMGTSTKELIQMFLNAWAEFKHVDNNCGFRPTYETESPGLVFSYGLHARWLVMDIIFDVMEKQIEAGQINRLTERDRRDAEQVMMAIWNTLSSEIFELLEEMHVSELQISQIKFVRWIADDFIISFPRYRTAHEGRNVLYTPHPAKPASPLCHLHDGGEHP